jgi:hypothetical protein
MFGSLIRRKRVESWNPEDATFESTTFSLSTAVPRPCERRTDDRVPAIFQIAKMTCPVGAQLIQVRNISAGGMLVQAGRPPAIGEQVAVELSTQKIPTSVVWIRHNLVGLKFDHNNDLGELLAGRKPRHGFRARPPRLEVGCKASIRIAKVYYTVDVHDISLDGLKVGPIDDYCVGKDVVVVVESLRPIRGQVRWFADRRAGIVFKEPLAFEELADWVGKRLELASLKASYQPR